MLSRKRREKCDHGTIVGIDLGTTNSEVAIVRDGQPHRLRGGRRSRSCRRSSACPRTAGCWSARRPRNQWVLAPERTIKSIKRKMGQDVKVKLGDQEYRPQEISAMILQALRDRAAAQLGQPVNKAVITVPAYFNDAQRQATREAGELAGLEVVRILNEPTAASLTYDPSQRELRRMLVYDLGGGTFDVSDRAGAGRRRRGAVQPRRHAARRRRLRRSAPQPTSATASRRSTASTCATTCVARARVLRAVEAAKRHLSDHPFARIEEEFIAEKDGQALHLNLEISRDEYEELIRPLLDRTMDCVQRALDDAHLTPSPIDKVVLVGGSTRTPLIVAAAGGAARPAGRIRRSTRTCAWRWGRRSRRPSSPAPTSAPCWWTSRRTRWASSAWTSQHAASRSSSASRRSSTATRRCRPRAARCSTPSTTTRREVEIDVYQGESDDVRRNHRVGHFLIQGLARGAGRQSDRRAARPEPRRHAEGVGPRDGRPACKSRSTIENALARFEREERDQARERLEQLWGLPGGEEDFDDEDENEDEDERRRLAAPAEEEMPSLVPGPREGQRETVQARALLEKAERLLERTQPEDRAEVER